MKPLVYVAAPFSADPVGNTRTATLVGQSLWRTGKVAVIVPHWSLIGDAVASMPVDDWYAFDLDVLAHCHAVLRLPGESKGADAEVERAGELGLPVFTVLEAVVTWAEQCWPPDGHQHCDRDPVECSYQEYERLKSVMRKLAREGGMRRGTWTDSEDAYIEWDEGYVVDVSPDEAAVWDALIKAAW